MPIQRPESAKRTSGNTQVYRSIFIARAHQILKMGYQSLDAGSYCNSEEEDITGELTLAMKNALEDRAAPRWSKNFWVTEEVRVNAENRRGKRRLRIDIEIIQNQQGPRPKVRFEAKRLSDTASIREYLGGEGLARFLDGRYASEDNVAGMLGFVQSESVAHHAAELESALKLDNSALAITDDEQWVLTRFSKCLDCYRTTHFRLKGLEQIVLLHTLLDFSGN